MKIEELIPEDITDQGKVIDELKSKRLTKQPDTSKARKQLDPLKHDVMDQAIRPDKKVKVDNGDSSDNVINVTDSEESTSVRIEKVARVSVALQKIIVKRAKSFLFGNDVKYNAQTKTDKEKLVHEAVKKILKAVKSETINRKIAEQVFSGKESAELWYPVPVSKTQTGTNLVAKVKDAVNNMIGNKYHEKYGFKSKYKLRCAIFSPLLGDTLWPYFDDSGDLLAFSREYEMTDGNNTAHKFFETYTDEAHYRWQHSQNGWELAEGFPRENVIGKIPIIYAYQDYYEWEDVQNLIETLEKLLSDFDDSNAYNAWPKIFTKGEIKGFSKKGETGGIIEGEEGSDAKYLEYNQATESVKLEIDTLLRFIYTLTQTPDISFDSVKDIGAISGVALKLLFTDAHLKAKDKMEIFDEFLERRVSVIKAFIAKMNTALASECETLEIDPEITPFMIEDEKTLVEVLTTANGNKPLVSKKLAAKLSGLAQNADEDYAQILKEEKEESMTSVFEPTV
jgi:hypothetical protein